MAATIKSLWNHPYCERFFRLAALALVIFIPSFLWFGLGWDRHPGLFVAFVVGLPVLMLTVAIPAGWLSRANLRKSWGWLFGRGV